LCVSHIVGFLSVDPYRIVRVLWKKDWSVLPLPSFRNERTYQAIFREISSEFWKTARLGGISIFGVGQIKVTEVFIS
jgi:hypothetical protein